MTATKPHNQFTPEETAAAVFNPFKVGDGATVHGYSDAAAYTVLKVTRTTVTLQRDKATLLNGTQSGEPDALTFTPGGFCGHTEGRQRYKYEANPEGEIIVAHLKKSPRKVSLPCGEWEEVNGSLRTQKLEPFVAFKSSRVTPGRFEHYDFNF